MKKLILIIFLLVLVALISYAADFIYTQKSTEYDLAYMIKEHDISSMRSLYPSSEGAVIAKTKTTVLQVDLGDGNRMMFISGQDTTNIDTATFIKNIPCSSNEFPKGTLRYVGVSPFTSFGKWKEFQGYDSEADEKRFMTIFLPSSKDVLYSVSCNENIGLTYIVDSRESLEGVWETDIDALFESY